jgi:transposase-like protein
MRSLRTAEIDGVSTQSAFGDLFKWRHFPAEIIILCVRWYLRYKLSYEDLTEMMAERGAHNVLQIRTRVINDELRSIMQRWNPSLQIAA